jgi:hypothetical protein
LPRRPKAAAGRRLIEISRSRSSLSFFAHVEEHSDSVLIVIDSHFNVIPLNSLKSVEPIQADDPTLNLVGVIGVSKIKPRCALRNPMAGRSVSGELDFVNEVLRAFLYL